MVWCVVWVWFAFGLGVMVFDVGVVWMGGSVLGPVWVRVCLAVCAFVRVSLFCVVVLVGSSESDRQKDAATTHTRSERVANTEREDHAFMQPGRVLGVRPFILVGVHYQRALCVSHPLKE